MTDPAKRQLLKPFEIVGFSAIAGVFAFGVVFLVTREWFWAGVFGGGAFIVSLMVVALAVMAPKAGELEGGEMSRPVLYDSDEKRRIKASEAARAAKAQAVQDAPIQPGGVRPPRSEPQDERPDDSAGDRPYRH